MSEVTTITGPGGAAVVYKGFVEFAAGGKNGRRKAEAFHLLATVGRTRESKRVAGAVGLTFKAGEEAVDIFRDRNKGEEQ